MIESYLREILKEKSITQEELSKMTGIRLATISFYCTNKWRYISKDHLEKLCKILDCKIGDIIRYKV